MHSPDWLTGKPTRLHRQPYIGRTWTELPTWLYEWHLLVLLWVGFCIGFGVSWIVK